MFRKEFETSKNPIYVIQTIILADHLNRPIPQWAINFLVDKLLIYIDEQGKKSLDSIFELRKRSGQDNAFKTWVIEERNAGLFLDVFILHKVFGIPEDEAIGMVNYRFQNTSWYDEPGQKWRLIKIKEKTMRNLYYKWKRDYNNINFILSLETWTKIEKGEYLAGYEVAIELISAKTRSKLIEMGYLR